MGRVLIRINRGSISEIPSPLSYSRAGDGAKVVEYNWHMQTFIRKAIIRNRQRINDHLFSDGIKAAVISCYDQFHRISTRICIYVSRAGKNRITAIPEIPGMSGDGSRSY